MQKKIVVTIGFSVTAWHAIKYALERHKHNACDFYILT